MPPRSPKLNPPVAALGKHNAVMGGFYPAAGAHRSPDRQVVAFDRPLSLKVVLRGQAEWQVGRRRYLVDAGHCLVLNRDETYSLTLEPAEPVETFCPFFAHGFVEAAVRSLANDDLAMLDTPRVTVAPFAVEPHVRPLPQILAVPVLALRRLAAQPATDDLAWESAFVDLSLALARSEASWQTEHGRSNRRVAVRTEITRRLDRARDFIHAEADRRVVLDEMAAVACLSPHHFHRLFRATFRMTPAAYMTRLRLLRAARRLAATDRSVIEICLASGFESLGSFSTRFRRSFGLPPAAWRRIARSEKHTSTGRI